MTLEISPVAEPARRLADSAVASAPMISDRHRLDSYAQTLASAPVIGLDTEFVRERTYFPRPGLVQISDGQSIGLLDAVGLPKMEALGHILERKEQIKVLHSVGEDLEVLEILTGTLPEPLFDTQVAAAMLGYPLQSRYESLVAEVLGVELAGGKARSDWCRRPLTRDLLTYAAQDVIWLPRLQEILSEALDRQNRLSWLHEDCERLVRAARTRASGEAAVLRVKGAGSLDDRQLELLGRLAEWRDDEARRRDLPRSFVVRDELLMALASSRPGIDREQKFKLLPTAVQRRQLETLESILDAAPRAEFLRPDALKPLSPEQREQIQQAQREVTRLAADLALEPALLASRREITRLVRGDIPDWTHGWRRDLLKDILPL